VNYYLTAQLVGTYGKRCFFPLTVLESRLKCCSLFLLTDFLVVNVHKMSDKWSYGDICTFFKSAVSTKCHGALEALSRQTIAMEMREVRE
jgi:hypothetical protein